VNRTDELKDSLTRLAAKLQNVPSGTPNLEKISQAIANLNSPELDETNFAQRLKELAEAVIDARTSSTNEWMKQLPIPPYDLWLPFKAKNLRTNDQSDIGIARAVINQVLGRIELPKRDPELDKHLERLSKVHGRS